MTPIRQATPADLPQILALGRDMHDESPTWGRLSYVPERVLAYLKALIPAPSALVLVAEVDGALVAGLICVAEPHWSSYDLVAHEIAFFVAPPYRGSGLARRLVDTMSAWAYEHGCVMLQAGTTTGLEPERCAQFYEALGFTRTSIGLETWWGKGLGNGA